MEEKMFEVEVGKRLWNRAKTEYGIIKSITYRRCACCGYGEAYLVEWPDGKRTKPCAKGIGCLENGDFFIR